jgi:hypothetical protein
MATHVVACAMSLQSHLTGACQSCPSRTSRRAPEICVGSISTIWQQCIVQHWEIYPTPFVEHMAARLRPCILHRDMTRIGRCKPAAATRTMLRSRYCWDAHDECLLRNMSELRYGIHNWGQEVRYKGALVSLVSYSVLAGCTQQVGAVSDRLLLGRSTSAEAASRWQPTTGGRQTEN